jgi:hypothetical protein
MVDGDAMLMCMKVMTAIHREIETQDDRPPGLVAGAGARRDARGPSPSTRRRSTVSCRANRLGRRQRGDGDRLAADERRRERLWGSPEPKRPRQGPRRPARDALRQKSIGIIEEIPEKAIVEVRKPAGRHRLADSR